MPKTFELKTRSDDGHLSMEVGEWDATECRLVGTYPELFATSMKVKWDNRTSPATRPEYQERHAEKGTANAQFGCEIGRLPGGWRKSLSNCAQNEKGEVHARQ